MKKISLLYLVAVLFTISCTQEVNNNDYDTYGSISGIVADKTTGEPVPVVNVKLEENGASTVTGSDGSFSFKDLDDGSYTIKISKEGYKDNSATAKVSWGKTTETHLLIERIPAVLTIDRDVLDFGENYSNTTLSFSMVNKNYVDLDWEIVYSCRWIKEIDPIKSVAKLGFGKTQTIVVIIDRDNLLPGDNETVIVVRTSDGATELTVKATGQEKRLATLNMSETTDIKATSAVLHAEITDRGIPEYTERGFVISGSDMPTLETAIRDIRASVTQADAFSERVDELGMGQTYYVRAYAINSQGIAYSTNQNKFKTIAVLPSVIILPTTDIKSSSAILNAQITDSGTPEFVERGFVIGDTEMPTKETAIKVLSAPFDAQNNYSMRVGDLAIGHTYSVRAYVSNAVGIAYSSTMDQFSTIATLPSVVTLTATGEDRETQTAVLHGSISYEGDPAYTECGFVWSTDYENPTIEEEKVVVSMVGSGDFEKRVTFPNVSQTIYVRAYATNQRGTAYGEPLQVFQTEYIVLTALKLGVQRTDINSTTLYWEDANALCKNSRVANLSNWRLPTKDELFQLYNLKDEIGGFKDSKYWSSTPYDTISHYYIDFYDGYSTFSNYHYRARCVRSL